MGQLAPVQEKISKIRDCDKQIIHFILIGQTI